jgi:hypothetical protein
MRESFELEVRRHDVVGRNPDNLEILRYRTVIRYRYAQPEIPRGWLCWQKELHTDIAIPSRLRFQNVESMESLNR